jgi:hypothetical protein
MSYLRFEERGLSDSGKTKRWAVLNTLSQSVLGWVQWYSGFRAYVYQSIPEIVYDHKCMTEIGEFLRERTQEHKS